MRYNIVEYQDASNEVKGIYDEIMKTMQTRDLPNWVKALGSNSNLLRANWEKAKGTLLLGEVPHILKELIIFVISVKRGSEYCASCHAHAALRLDKSLSYEDLDSLVSGEAYEGMPESYKVAIDVALKSALHPAEITDQDIESLYQEGFDDEEVSEILAQADLAVMFNTITTTIGLPIDDEYKRESCN